MVARNWFIHQGCQQLFAPEPEKKLPRKSKPSQYMRPWSYMYANYTQNPIRRAYNILIYIMVYKRNSFTWRFNIDFLQIHTSSNLYYGSQIEYKKSEKGRDLRSHDVTITMYSAPHTQHMHARTRWTTRTVLHVHAPKTFPIWRSASLRSRRWVLFATIVFHCMHYNTYMMNHRTLAGAFLTNVRTNWAKTIWVRSVKGFLTDRCTKGDFFFFSGRHKRIFSSFPADIKGYFVLFRPTYRRFFLFRPT